jgi:hypothetical protein
VSAKSNAIPARIDRLFTHLVIVMEENEGYDHIIGRALVPFRILRPDHEPSF